ncbi:MAG: response regulator transcription factor [Vicinamibacterales bacterium]
MKRVLVIEDDPELLEALKDNLEAEGYDVMTARDGEQGVRVAAQQHPEAIVLDLMMPKLNGFDVCRTLRARGVAAPILIVTARGEEKDKIRGFELGADDYLTKPFSVHELLARLRAIIRRSSGPAAQVRSYRFGDVVVDFVNRRLCKGTRTTTLSNLEIEVLRYFVSHRGQVIRRDDLLTAVWGYRAFTTRAADNLVARLRNKIEDSPHQPKYILSVYGVGYKFVD